MCGEKCQILGNRAFDPLGLHAGICEIAAV
jgi:hypothetical protein